jgi:hypothetical protein
MPIIADPGKLRHHNRGIFARLSRCQHVCSVRRGNARRRSVDSEDFRSCGAGAAHSVHPSILVRWQSDWLRAGDWHPARIH